MVPADWMSASHDAHCLVGFSLKSVRKRERICRHHRDLQTVFGIKLTPLTGLNRTQNNDTSWVRSSGNNDNSVILFGRHAGISPLLQCLGRLSQPIVPSLRSGAIGVTAAFGIAVGPIYQRVANTYPSTCLHDRLSMFDVKQVWFCSGK